MKTFLLVLALFVAMYAIVEKQSHRTLLWSTIKYKTPTCKPALKIVYFQDVSGSITSHGVVMVDAQAFGEYYRSTSRDIDLDFGLITSNSAEQLLHLSLPAYRLKYPIRPNYSSVWNPRELKAEYAEAIVNYTRDSLSYFKDREERFIHFADELARREGIFKTQLSDKTDLSTAIAIGDRVLNEYTHENVKQFILLNTDGQDSYKKTFRLHNKAAVILIGANGLGKTSIDSLVTLKLESTESAVRYTLNNSSY